MSKLRTRGATDEDVPECRNQEYGRYQVQDKCPLVFVELINILDAIPRVASDSLVRTVRNTLDIHLTVYDSISLFDIVHIFTLFRGSRLSASQVHSSLPDDSRRD